MSGKKLQWGMFPHETREQSEARMQRWLEGQFWKLRDQAECRYSSFFALCCIGFEVHGSWEPVRDRMIEKYRQCHSNVPVEDMKRVAGDLVQRHASAGFRKFKYLVEFCFDPIENGAVVRDGELFTDAFEDEEEVDKNGNRPLLRDEILLCLALADARRKMVRFPRWLSPQFRAWLRGKLDWVPGSFDKFYSTEYHALYEERRSDTESN
jgi:hypothetical protein